LSTVIGKQATHARLLLGLLGRQSGAAYQGLN